MIDCDRLLRGLVVLIASVSLLGCATTEVNPLPVTTLTTPLNMLPDHAAPSFRLVPGDEIEIKFFDRADLNEITRVRPDGLVDLPLIGSVRAYGLMPDQLATAIAAAYRALGSGSAPNAEISYLLAVGDELEIRLPYQTGMDQTVKVRPDGRISLPLAGTLQAQGGTPEQLEQELNRRYAQHFRKPAVSVSVRNYSSSRISVNGRAGFAALADLKPTVLVRTPVARQIYVGGEVVRGGALPHRHALTALQAIVEAGSLKSISAGSHAAVLRQAANGVQVLPIDVSTLSSTTVSAPRDLVLEPFDIVIVPKTPLAAAAEAVDQVFNLLPPLRNSTFGLIYQLDKNANSPTTLTTRP